MVASYKKLKESQKDNGIPNQHKEENHVIEPNKQPIQEPTSNQEEVQSLSMPIQICDQQCDIKKIELEKDLIQ